MNKTMTPKQHYYENIADTVIKKFNLRGIEGYYCATKDEALATAKRFLTPECTVSWGGSMTLNEIGLIDDLYSSDCIVYDRFSVPAEERAAMYQKIVGCDYYFMSSNAITLDGQLINVDGGGNRVACLIYGPKNVIVIAGMNKLVPNVQAGMDRVRNMAAPPNCNRLELDTPCASSGQCANCLVDDCICANTVITRKSMTPGRIKVILVGEELGY
ncbi:lactate utilization protein [Anaerolentibacter hominis]|uniref:lactate utilization protein n=1 Tax=Anaerolentibacter hominis TaxID=3079009 RepID=UPI0031B8AA68